MVASKAPEAGQRHVPNSPSPPRREITSLTPDPGLPASRIVTTKFCGPSHLFEVLCYSSPSERIYLPIQVGSSSGIDLEKRWQNHLLFLKKSILSLMVKEDYVLLANTRESGFQNIKGLTGVTE